MKTTLIVLGLIFGWCGQESKPKGEEPAAALKKVMEANLDAYNREDLEDVMDTVHSKSPLYASSESVTKQIFEKYDLTYKITRFAFVGADDEYAIARVKQETKKVKGPAFRDNQVDALQVFKKEGGSWKIWQSTILEIKYVE